MDAGPGERKSRAGGGGMVRTDVLSEGAFHPGRKTFSKPDPGDLVALRREHGARPLRRLGEVHSGALWTDDGSFP